MSIVETKNKNRIEVLFELIFSVKFIIVKETFHNRYRD